MGCTAIANIFTTVLFISQPELVHSQILYHIGIGCATDVYQFKRFRIESDFSPKSTPISTAFLCPLKITSPFKKIDFAPQQVVLLPTHSDTTNYTKAFVKWVFFV